MDSAIQLYLAWNRSFIVMLDSDGAGEKEKKRYIDKFGKLVEHRIFLINEVDEQWKGYAIERLFTKVEVLEIQNSAYPGDKSQNKTHFSRAIQELLVNKKPVALSSVTVENFRRIYDFVGKMMPIIAV